MSYPQPRMPDSTPQQFDDLNYNKYGYLYDYDQGQGIRIHPLPSEQKPGIYHRSSPYEDGVDEPPRIRAQEMRRLLENKPEPNPENPFEDRVPTADLIERLNAYREEDMFRNRKYGPRDVY